jgi:hypothetical protein
MNLFIAAMNKLVCLLLLNLFHVQGNELQTGRLQPYLQIWDKDISD